MKQILTTIIIAVLMLVVIAALYYGGFRLKRWFNYSFGYSSDVKADIDAETQPLKQEIDALKKRIDALEGKK
jgi:hypothetical protein